MTNELDNLASKPQRLPRLLKRWFEWAARIAELRGVRIQRICCLHEAYDRWVDTLTKSHATLKVVCLCEGMIVRREKRLECFLCSLLAVKRRLIAQHRFTTKGPLDC